MHLICTNYSHTNTYKIEWSIWLINDGKIGKINPHRWPCGITFATFGISNTRATYDVTKRSELLDAMAPVNQLAIMTKTVVKQIATITMAPVNQLATMAETAVKHLT